MIEASHAWYADHLRPVMERLPELPADVAIVAGFPDVRAATRSGHRRIVLMQHGIGQSYSNVNPHYPGGRGNDDVGLFLVPNEHAAARWREAYPNARVEVVGSPRLDDLPAREAGPPTVAVSFHWDGYMTPESRSAFPYFRSALPTLAKAFHVIGHGHPRRKDLATFYERHGIEYVPSFEDVCRRADVYVCDNSSTIYEFASTGRPVVVLNAPSYRPQVWHGLRFWDAANVGPPLWFADDLVPVVESVLLHPETDVERRERALERVYAYRHGAAERAAAAITDWLQ